MQQSAGLPSYFEELEIQSQFDQIEYSCYNTILYKKYSHIHIGLWLRLPRGLFFYKTRNYTRDKIQQLNFFQYYVYTSCSIHIVYKFL
jgi:hypothetical protein